MKRVIYWSSVSREREDPCICVPSKHGGPESGKICSKCGRSVYSY